MQEYKNTRIQEYKNARMQECKNARMILVKLIFLFVAREVW